MSKRTDAPVAGGQPKARGEAPVAGGQPKADPFVLRLPLGWGDADPALMIYTGRFPDFALRAIDGWFQDRVGASFYVMNMDWGIGTPFVHLECDFRSPVTPRDVLLIAVQVDRVGATSLGFRVAAHVEADGRLCFEGRFVCVCVEGGAQSKAGARPMPLDLRIRTAAEAEMSGGGGPLGVGR